MPSAISAATPDTAAATFPPGRLAADDPIPAAASNSETARQAAAHLPRHRAAGQAP
jgi:hypothetical protein